MDETFAGLQNGVVRPRRGNIGPPVNPLETTRVVEFNDLNAWVLLTPFHNMALMCPETTVTDIDQHTKSFAEAAGELAPG